MGFINKEEPIVLNIMLTTKGREQLSMGNLKFKYFALGDSEIDYNHNRVALESNNQVKILKPCDRNPNIISFIKRNYTGDTYNSLNTVTSLTHEAVNDVEPIGFFVDNSYIVESTHVKQPDLYVVMSGVTGGTKLNLKKSLQYGRNVTEPSVNDFIYIKWTTNSNSVTDFVDKTKIYPNLTYKIVSKTGTLIDDNIQITVDRMLPDYTGFGLSGTSGCLIYNNVLNDTNTSTDYLSESVIAFHDNYECGINRFPFWNMSIIYTEELIGINEIDKKYTKFNTSNLGGFVSYIQNHAPYYKKMGVIHYSNNSPANTYGEEFYLTTPKLEIPTIMWHKNSNTELGVTLTAFGDLKTVTGETSSLNLKYYDLADMSGNVVGKVFNELKIFVIEDQELLFAMSYKSNRSWTLPDYLVGNTNSDLCPTAVVPPTTPTLFDIEEIECDSITLNWSQSIGIGTPIKFILYRKDSINNEWVVISDNITGNTYNQLLLVNGVTYYYKIVAYDIYGVISNESNVKEYTVSCYQIPTTPVLNPIQINEGIYDSLYNSFYVTWSESQSVNLPISYTLLSKKTTDTNWNIIADSISDMSYIHNNLTSGQTYRYKVIAIDVNNVQSAVSNIESKLVGNPT